MNKTKQLSDVWLSEFGNEYTKRKLKVHDTEGDLRTVFWSQLIRMLPELNSILEIGCNTGMNLDGIYKANPKLSISGIEPNEYAFKVALDKSKGKFEIIKNDVFNYTPSNKVDLVFTCTVLIHISPSDIIKAIKRINGMSKKYILIMEYYWPEVKRLEYRGLKDILWKQDYGVLLLQNTNAKLIETGYLDARDGFDRVTWWLFEK